MQSAGPSEKAPIGQQTSNNSVEESEPKVLSKIARLTSVFRTAIPFVEDKKMKTIIASTPEQYRGCVCKPRHTQ